MVCCQARVSSTLARPLPSVVITRVGQAIVGTSARMSAHAMVGMKLICVEAAVRPMNWVHQVTPCGGNVLPRRSPMLSWAQRATPPGCSKAVMSAGARSAAPTRYGGGVPTTVSVRTRAGRRAAKARAIVPPILAPMRWKRSTPRVSIRRQKSSIRRSRVQGKSRGMGVEAPKPRMSGRTTRYQGARCGTQPYQAAPLSALPWSMRTVAGGRQGSVESSTS
jgi:hypothetical protein